jgi:hypothetical protein
MTMHQCMISQNVGIGTTTPAFKLDVSGRMRVKTGTLNNVSTSSGIWMEDYRDGTNRAFVGMQDSIRVGFYGAGIGGTGWGFNFNTVTGNVGIGITNALSALHVHSPDNTYNSYLRLTHQTSGTSFSDGAYMGLDGNNLLLNNSENGMILFSNAGGDRLNISSGGNVGIGTGVTTPQTKLHIDGGTNVGSGSGGYLQLGSSSGANMAFDNNEIQARSNGVPSQLFLQNDGGGTTIGGGTGVIVITSSGEVRKPFVTGNANMLPICYGKIRDNGTIAGGSGNFTVTKHPTLAGRYYISINGETNMGLNPDQYMIIASPSSPSSFGIEASNDIYVVNSIMQAGTYNNTIGIRTKEFTIDYVNKSVVGDCNVLDCQYKSVSYLTNMPGPRDVDGGFTFMVYKL